MSRQSTSPVVNEIRDKKKFIVFEYIKLPNGTIQHITSPVQYNLFNVNQIEYRTNVNPDYCCVFNRTLDVSVDCILTLDSHSFVNNNQSMFDKDSIQFKNIVVNTTQDVNQQVVKNSLCNQNQCDTITFNNRCNFTEPIRLFEKSFVKSIHVNNSEEVTSKSGGFVSLNSCEQLNEVVYNKLQDCSEFNLTQLENLFMDTSNLINISNLEYNNVNLGNSTLLRTSLFRIKSFTNSINDLKYVGENNFYFVTDLGDISHFFSTNTKVKVGSINFANCSGITIRGIEFILESQSNSRVDYVFFNLNNCNLDNSKIYLSSTGINSVNNCLSTITNCELNIMSSGLSPQRCTNCVINYDSTDSIELGSNYGLSCSNCIFYFLNVQVVNGICKQSNRCLVIGPEVINASGLFENGELNSNECYLPKFNVQDSNSSIGWNSLKTVYLTQTSTYFNNWITLIQKYNSTIVRSIWNYIYTEFKNSNFNIQSSDKNLLLGFYKSIVIGKSNGILKRSSGYKCIETTFRKNGLRIEDENQFFKSSVNCRIVP